MKARKVEIQSLASKFVRQGRALAFGLAKRRGLFLCARLVDRGTAVVEDE
jgi:hypothetical protein